MVEPSSRPIGSRPVFGRPPWSTTRRRYGYQWYLGELALAGKTGSYGAKWIGAFGLGGQRLFVFPELEFVLAVTAGNYATEDQGRAPIAILREVFLASIVG